MRSASGRYWYPLLYLFFTYQVKVPTIFLNFLKHGIVLFLSHESRKRIVFHEVVNCLHGIVKDRFCCSIWFQQWVDLILDCEAHIYLRIFIRGEVFGVNLFCFAELCRVLLGLVIISYGVSVSPSRERERERREIVDWTLKVNKETQRYKLTTYRNVYSLERTPGLCDPWKSGGKTYSLECHQTSLFDVSISVRPVSWSQ